MTLNSNGTNDSNNNDNIEDDIEREFGDYLNSTSGNGLDDLLRIYQLSDDDILATIEGAEDIRRNNTPEIRQQIIDERRQELIDIATSVAMAEVESLVQQELGTALATLGEQMPSTSLNSYSIPNSQGNSQERNSGK